MESKEENQIKEQYDVGARARAEEIRNPGGATTVNLFSFATFKQRSRRCNKKNFEAFDKASGGRDS